MQVSLILSFCPFFKFYMLNTADSMTELELCVLCESPADVKFEPCGHTIMCKECADRAKRCPNCKVQVCMRLTTLELRWLHGSECY